MTQSQTVNKLPPKIKKYLIGSVIRWSDENPLSGDMEEELLFSFDTNTKPQVDLLLKRHGVWDVSHIVNADFWWEVHIEIIYETPNNKEKSHHIDHHWFKFRGPIFPTTDKFKSERETFYILKNLEHTQVPDDHKNKGYYRLTRFTATAVAI